VKRRPPPCQVPEPKHSLKRARLYPAGWLCDRHSPWARLGLPEPLPGPGWPSAAWSTPTAGAVAAVIDNRAIASGKRRSSSAAYRAAQAATRKDR
jgi:hypothetical protein